MKEVVIENWPLKISSYMVDQQKVVKMCVDSQLRCWRVGLYRVITVLVYYVQIALFPLKMWSSKFNNIAIINGSYYNYVAISTLCVWKLFLKYHHMNNTYMLMLIQAVTIQRKVLLGESSADYTVLNEISWKFPIEILPNNTFIL